MPTQYLPELSRMQADHQRDQAGGFDRDVVLDASRELRAYQAECIGLCVALGLKTSQSAAGSPASAISTRCIRLAMPGAYPTGLRPRSNKTMDRARINRLGIRCQLRRDPSLPVSTATQG